VVDFVVSLQVGVFDFSVLLERDGTDFRVLLLYETLLILAIVAFTLTQFVLDRVPGSFVFIHDETFELVHIAFLLAIAFLSLMFLRLIGSGLRLSKI